MLSLTEAQAGKSVSFFESTTRRRSKNDCQRLGSACWIRSFVAKEDNKAEERAMATRRLQFPEEIRSADEKDAKTFHGDGLPKAFAKNVVHAALDVLERLDKNIVLGKE